MVAYSFKKRFGEPTGERREASFDPATGRRFGEGEGEGDGAV